MAIVISTAESYGNKSDMLKNARVTFDKIGHYASVLLAFSLPVSTALTSCAMILVLLCWLVSIHWERKKEILFSHPLVQWLFPIIILTCVASSYSAAESKEMFRGINDGMRLFAIPILIYFYQDEKTKQQALWAFTGAMVLTLFLGFLKWYGDFPIGLKYTTAAVFKSHIKTSLFMAIALYFLAIQAKQQPSIRWPCLAIILTMLYYLFFMNIGRIGYLAICLCALVFAWHCYRLKGILYAAMGLMVVIVCAYFSSELFAQRMTQLLTDWDFYRQGGRLLESSLGSRVEFALTSIDLIKQKPWLGWGTGSFGTVYEILRQGDNTLLTDNPHNEYLRFAVEFGLVGLGMLILLFFQQWKCTRQLTTDKLFAQGVLLTFFAGCFFNSWVKDFAEAYFYCVMSALCFAQLKMRTIPKWQAMTVH